MVNKKDDSTEDDIEITNEDKQPEDLEIEEIEEKSGAKLKQLREKLKTCEVDKRQAQEDLQRAKAEFLNAKKRLEDERMNDRIRAQMQHAEELLPLCDSFQMAMSDRSVWEKADKSWRTGVEGIHMQLMKLLQRYNVSKIEALGNTFDPHRFEAVDTEPVTDESQVDVVQKVLQDGYEMQLGDETRVIRPARVVTGTLEVNGE